MTDDRGVLINLLSSETSARLNGEWTCEVTSTMWTSSSSLLWWGLSLMDDVAVMVTGHFTGKHTEKDMRKE